MTVETGVAQCFQNLWPISMTSYRMLFCLDRCLRARDWWLLSASRLPITQMLYSCFQASLLVNEY